MMKFCKIIDAKTCYVWATQNLVQLSVACPVNALNKWLSLLVISLFISFALFLPIAHADFATATPISYSDDFDTDLPLTSGTYNWHSFDLNKGDGVSIALTAHTNSSNSVYFYVYGPDQKTINLNQVNADNGQTATMSLTAVTTGTYYIRVGGPSGSYDLGVFNAFYNADSTDDSRTFNVTRTTAKYVLSAAYDRSSLMGSSNPLSDSYRFEAIKGSAITINLTAHTNNSNSMNFYVFGPDQNTINSSQVNVGNAKTGIYSFTAQVTGVYYLQINGPAGWYDLSVTGHVEDDLDNDGDGLVNTAEYVRGTNPDVADSDGDGIDDYEEALNGTRGDITIEYTLDDMADATSFSTSVQMPVTDEFISADHDGLIRKYFALDINQGDRFSIALTAHTNSSNSIYFYLYGPDQKNINSNQVNAGNGQTATFSFTAATTGTYYIGVNGPSGSYDLGIFNAFSNSGITDDSRKFNSTLTTATYIRSGAYDRSSLAGSSNPLPDSYRFDAIKGSAITVNLTAHTNSSNSIYFNLYGPDQDKINTSQVNVANAKTGTYSFTVQVTGTYYLQVNGPAGWYDLSVNGHETYTPTVTAVSPTTAATGTAQNYTITGTNLTNTIVGNIEGTPGHCTYLSGSGTSVVLNCSAALTGKKRFYLAQTTGGSAIPGSENLYIDVSDDRTAGNPALTGGKSINGVDVGNGNLHLAYSDLSVLAKGVPFSLERSYNSTSNRWSFGYDQTLTVVQNSGNPQINIIREDGRSDAYFKDDTDNFWYPANAANFDMLKANSNGTYSLYTKGSIYYTFSTPDGGGKAALTGIGDRDGNSLTITTASATQKTITDGAGRTYTLDYDAGGRLIKATDFAGRYVEYTWNAGGALSAFRDVRGNSTSYQYNADGKLSAIIDPLGAVASPVYNSLAVTYVTASSTLSAAQHAGKVETVTDGAGGVTTYRYGTFSACTDGGLKATGVVRPKTNDGTTNNNMVFCRDAAGRVGEEINTSTIADFKTKHEYKSAATLQRAAEAGLVSKTTNPLGISTTFGYTTDGRGNRDKITNAKSESTNLSYKNETDFADTIGKSEFINLNVVGQFKTPLNNAYNFSHELGNVKSITNPLNKATNLSYTAGGLVNDIIDPNLNKTSFTYDTNGQVLTTTDAAGKTVTNGYDNLGRLISVKDKRGFTTSYSYDEAGNVLTVTDPLGKVTTNSYDANNNLLSVTDPRGNKRSYTYNKLNQVASESFKIGSVTYTRSYIYDPLNRLWKVTNENSNTSSVTFDAAGRKTLETDPLSNSTTYEYDANNNVTKLTDAAGHSTSYTYDELDRVLSKKDHLTNTVSYTYDAEGHVKSITDPKGKTTNYDYYADGTLKTVTDANSAVTTATYDNAGNVATISGPWTGNVVTYAYDNLNRMTTMKDAGNRTWSFAYDANGNLTSSNTPDTKATSYEYDALNRLTKATYPDSSTVAYTYDTNGNRLTMTDSSGTTGYTYDEANRLSSVTDTFGKTVSYTYDGVGNVKTVGYPGSKTLTYGYDNGERLTSVLNWLGRTTSYSYNNINQLTQIVNGNSTKALFTYDNANRLTGLQNQKGSGATISSHAYSLDANGNVTAATVTEPQVPTFGGSTTSLAFDLANRIITSGSTSFSHDLQGRIVSEVTGGVTKTYGYNFKDLLTTINSGTDSYSFLYNGDANRIASTKNGVQTRYVLDVNSDLPDVLAETDSAGTIKSYYTYGNGLISRIDAASGQEYFYHFDPTGNTLALTDSNQTITDSYAYTPYGELTASGTTLNPFRYSGKHGVMDDGNGLNYMRARYYKPSIARFMSLDAVWGDMGTPQSLNRYVYVQGDPMGAVDPSGNTLFTSIMSAVVKNSGKSGKITEGAKATASQVKSYVNSLDLPVEKIKLSSPVLTAGKESYGSITDLGFNLLNHGSGFDVSSTNVRFVPISELPKEIQKRYIKENINLITGEYLNYEYPIGKTRYEHSKRNGKFKYEFKGKGKTGYAGIRG